MMSVGKLFVKSATKMSLNDRFTELRRDNPNYEESDVGSAQMKIHERREHTQAMRRHQRSNAQMERRPVPNSFKENMNGRFLIHNRTTRPKLERKTTSPVKQRIAPSLQSRLTLPNGYPLLRGARGARFINSTRGAVRGNYRGRGYSTNRSYRGFRGNSQTTRGSTYRGSRGGRSFRGRWGRGRANGEKYFGRSDSVSQMDID